MDKRENGLLLEECRMAAGQTMAPTAEAKLNYRKYKGQPTEGNGFVFYRLTSETIQSVPPAPSALICMVYL